MKEYDWGLFTVPQRHCENQRIPYTQAKLIGGGGAINSQVFTRGSAADYDGWADKHGCTGWGFDQVLPYFLRSEANTRLSAPFHGTDGPLGVSDQINPHPLSLAFVKAGQELGLPYNSDFNGADQYGIGLYQCTTRHGRRCSAVTAYLRPARGRPNLTIKTHALVTRVLLEGDRAVGVEIVGKGEVTSVRARREVLVAAGAIGSPKILQLSGIGDPDHLHEAGVKVRHELAGVGRNLQDHCAFDILYELNTKQSLDRFNHPGPGMAAAVFQYALFRTGPLASTVVEAGAFTTSSGEPGRPDIQFHFLPAAGTEAAHEEVKPGYRAKLDTYFLYPRSRGTVRIASSDPARAPLVDPNFLEDDYDVEMAIAAVKQGREIMAEPSMARWVKAEHIGDGSKLAKKEDWVKFVRRFARTAYHPSGTCAMGTAEESVVSTDLKVHGLQGLRVIDASVMPTLVGANTQAPTVMIAERGTDFILSEG
jgi:choline dehydrogenase